MLSGHTLAAITPNHVERSYTVRLTYDRMPIGSHVQPDSRRMQIRLFEKMEQEFGERGVDAVEMLKTAELLLEQTEQASRQALAAAYCIRQAVVEIFRNKKDDRNLWHVVSRQVVEAKHRFENAGSVLGKKHRNLLDAVDKLEKIHDDRTAHQARLEATIRLRTGLDPLTGEDSPLNVYQRTIGDLNHLTHPSPGKTQNDTDAVRTHYRNVIDTLAKILLPIERLEEITRLAVLHEPQSANAVSLKENMVSVNDFDYFASRMVSATWFRIMDRDMLKPPSDGSPWLVRHIVHYLKNEHLDAFVSLVDENLDDWTKNEAGLDGLGFVGFRLGDRGLPFLVRALQKNPESRSLCSFASMAYSKTEASNPWVARLADLLLNPDSGLGYHDRIDTVPARLVDGMDLSSSAKRIKILAFKIRDLLKRESYCHIPRHRSIAAMDRGGPPVVNALIGHLCSALANGRRLGSSTPHLIKEIAPLREDIRTRLVTWLYSDADDIDCSSLVDFVVSNCRSRFPTGDDIALLDRLERDCDMKIVAARLTDAIGEAPEPEDLEDIMQQNGQREDDRRRIWWAVAVGNDIKLPGWKKLLNILDRRGINRASMREYPAQVFIEPKSPFGQEEFDSADPYDMAIKIAAWRPDAKNGLSLPSALGICSNLEDAVKRNPGKWTEDPVRVVEILRHPTYVAGYFRGLARVEGSLDMNADRMIPAVRLARKHPWPAVPLALSSLEYDHDWQNADAAGIDLIGEIARKNVQLNEESLSDAWEIVREAAIGQAATSSDHTLAATNRPHTNALQTMLYLIQYVRNRNDDVPKEVLEALTEELRLTGWNGAEYRAVIASHARFLRFSLPDWFKQNEPLLFGSEAPGNLAQVSLDEHLKWGNPDEGVLERYRKEVLDAVSRGVNNAMNCLLLGMFWGIDGYDQKSLTKNLARMGSKHVSLAGECAARMLKDEASPDSIRTGVSLWKHVLDSSPKPKALAGYGMWADVPALDQNQWELLTLRTCELAEGKLDWAGDVAKRIGSADTITDAGLKILKLMIRSDLNLLDASLVAEHALDALHRSKGIVGIRESWNLLHEAMLDRGFHQEV